MVADLESQRPLMEMSEKLRLTWEEIEQCLEGNDSDGLQKFIHKRGFDAVWRPINAPAKRTPLHRAAELGSLSCMKILIEGLTNSTLIDSPDCDGNTPLFSAVKAANAASVKELLKNNAHVNARNDQSHSVLHVLGYAIAGIKSDKQKQEEHLACVDVILERPDVDLEAHNNSGFTPLLAAAKKVSADEGVRRAGSLVTFCRKLVVKGASLDSSDRRGETARQVLEDRNALTAVLMGDRRPAPQRPFTSQLLDNIILGREGEQICEYLKRQPQEEASRAANCYLGSQTLLFYVVDKCDLKAVAALLDAGADPWKEQLSGEICLHRALSRGNSGIVDLLISYMKKRNSDRKLDMRDQSFRLLERILENHKKISTDSPPADYLQCLKRILKEDIILNINERSNTGISQGILNVAASFNNQEALQLLLENGAFLGSRKNVVGEDRGNILSALRPTTLGKAMDGCITHYPSPDNINDDNTEDILSPDHTLSFDYRFIVPPHDPDSKEPPPKRNEVETLMEVSRCRTHRRAIKHPLIQTFLYAKWRKVFPLYLTNLLLYLTFVVILTLFMYSLKDLRILEEKASKLSPSNSTIDTDITRYKYDVNVLMGLLIPVTLYMLFREIFQVIFTFRTYLKNFENYLEWFLIIVVVVLCFASLGVEVTRHLAAWAMIIAWYEFVLLLGRAPPLSIYVTMLRHVSWNFLKLIFLYGALILAFTVSFNIILQPAKMSEGDDHNDFGNFWSTLPKAIVMATGEFEYSGLSSEFSSRVIFATSAVLVFLVFLFLIFLVLMNVMNGLAVTDTQQVMDDATLYSLTSRLELIYLIEELLLVTPFLVKFISKFHLISGDKKPYILVKVNHPKKSRRIIYGSHGQDICKLDNDTAHIIRSYRLQQLAEAEERAKSDPMSQCLNILQELRDLTLQHPHLLSPTTLSPSSSRGNIN